MPITQIDHFEVILLLSVLPIALLSLFVLFAIRRSRTTERKLFRRDKELRWRMWELVVLREIGDRIGYSLDVAKIVEIVTGSVRRVIACTSVASLVVAEARKLVFKIDIVEPIEREFIKAVEKKALESFGLLASLGQTELAREEVITGLIPNGDGLKEPVAYFNLPLVVSGKFIGLINITAGAASLYREEEIDLLYKITNQSCLALSKLQTILDTEKEKIISMVSSMADGVIMTDREKRLVVINEAAKKMLKIEKTEVGIFDVIDALAGKYDLRTRIDQSFQSVSPALTDEITVADQVLQVLVSPVKGQSGDLFGAVLIFNDLTKEKQLERLREEFTAMMVHELRSPLTAMNGSADSLLLHLADLPKEKVGESIKLLKESSSQMLGIVGDLLDMAKIEAGKFEISLEDTDLTTLVSGLAESFRPLFVQKDLKLLVESNPDVPPHLPLDKTRISQVIRNLLSNALKFTNVGWVRIEIKKSGRSVVVSVSDSGEGIATENLPDLFTKFGQFSPSSDKRRFGTGLGLAICKGIIESHQGRIWVDSTLGQGTTISFSLPLDGEKIGPKVTRPRFHVKTD